MAISSLHASSLSAKPTPRWLHDVFLSFRGRDTRNNFTAHLYAALVNRGIKAYKDDKELERGSTIEPKLWKAIEDSMFSIVVFSNDYASSPWCLQELVKITQCMKTTGHTVLPVFYGMDPSDVADQTGAYEKAFVSYEHEYNKEKVKEWRNALSDASNLSGWDLRNRNESDTIREIVERIWNDVSQAFLDVDKDMVGMDFRLQRMKDFLAEDLTEVRFIGICGMGGVGKTTLAKVVYNNFYRQFEGSCFLQNIKEFFKNSGKVSLQENLLSQIMRKSVKDLQNEMRGVTTIRRYLQSKKVLVILDDVDDLDQLEILAAERTWFGSGSRVIITTRDSHLLSVFGVDGVYKVDLLSDEEAFDLFALKAFKQKQPQEEFMELSKLIMAQAQGLPLALSVLGAYLSNKSMDEWKSATMRFGEFSNNKILNALKISFDGLEDSHQQIFLDIACFLRGMDKKRAINILNGCGFDAAYGISVLVDRSLISITRNKLQMHDLLQRLGKVIVYRECPKEVRKRSRVWVPCDIFQMMESYSERYGEAIEAILLELPSKKDVSWNIKSFLNYRRLRLLKINKAKVKEGPTYLSKELRYLEWHMYPSKTLPSSFDPCNLVELDLSFSEVEKLWDGYKDAPNLRILNLSKCKNLTETLDFSHTPSIERLVLKGCEKLTKVHSSFQNLEQLVHLDLSCCSNLIEFPTIRQVMPQLQELCLDDTGLMTLPESIEKFTGLVILGLSLCRNLQQLPRSVVNLKKLKVLTLDGCLELEKLPSNLKLLESLEVLSLFGTPIRQLPKSAFVLKNLKKLIFRRYGLQSSKVMKVPSLSGMRFITNLQLGYCDLEEGSIPDDIGCLSMLTTLNLSGNKFVSLPRSLNQLNLLEELNLNNCKMLQSLPQIPSNVQMVLMSGCISLDEAPDPMKMPNIGGFQFFNCIELYKSNWLNRTVSVILQRYLQGFPNSRSGFQITIPGSKIPEWFTYQCKGCSILIRAPMDFISNKVMGIAACLAFPRGKSAGAISCDIKTRDTNVRTINTFLYFHQPAAYGHFWSFYLSLKELLEDAKVEFTGELEFNFTFSHVKESRFPSDPLEECGIRLVTIEDIEELKNMAYLQPQVDSSEDLDIDLEAAAALNREPSDMEIELVEILEYQLVAPESSTSKLVERIFNGADDDTGH